MSDAPLWQVIDPNTGRPLPQECAHILNLVPVTPSTLEGCEDCLREGTQWVHLRECLVCGHVACCENSPRRHASGHWKTTDHAVVVSFQPGEEWAWCYPDDCFLVQVES